MKYIIFPFARPADGNADGIYIYINQNYERTEAQLILYSDAKW